MHKNLLLLFLFAFSFALSQTSETAEVQELIDYNYKDFGFYNDTITYDKTTAYAQKRNFTNDIQNKYNGKDFEYVDDLKEEKKEPKETSEFDAKAADYFLTFMASIFPYLIGLIVVFIIIKTFINTEDGFWKFGRSVKNPADKLVFDDDENIDETDFEKLLQLAITNGNYRLATRYYYLSTLKKLSQKELIKYHKDKTNTEYQFELKKGDLRKNFSYLAYIYDYVWYGEFPVDEVKFSVIENRYKSFIQVI